MEGLPSLSLFGDLAWRQDGREVRLPPGRPTSIVVLLAEHQPAPLSAARILDCLWSEQPNSGANAVQRHVSALRRSLRAAGLPAETIETLPAGYRLHPRVSTDLTALDDLLSGSDAHVPGPDDRNPAVRWWLEPIPDVPWGRHTLFRITLTRRAVEAARRWTARARADGHVDMVVATLQSMSALHPEDETLWSMYADALVATGDRELVSAAHRRATAAAGSGLPPTRFDPAADRERRSWSRQNPPPSQCLADLQPCVARWVEGDGDGAFEELDRVGPRLAPDVARRIARGLVWTSAEDGHAALLWRHLVALADLTPQMAASVLASLDAYALEQMHDGLDVADGEVEQSATVDELVRSLQVRFLVGLGHPIDTGQVEVVERLGSMGHGVAQAESRRFQAVLAVKRGRLDDAEAHLDAYAAVTGRVWPLSRCHVPALARAILARHRQPAGFPAGIDTSVVPSLLNQVALDSSDLWHRLMQGHAPQSPLVAPTYHRVVHVAPPHLAQAFSAVRRVRLHGLSSAEQEVAALRSGAPTGSHDVQAASAALASISLETRSVELARRAFELLEPWSGEYLGVWPFHVVIGPADEYLCELGARTN